MEWSQVIADPSLRNLPYKIELNARGKIEMSPASTQHAIFQGRVIRRLSQQLQSGELLGECGIQTSNGVRVPDAAWASDDFIARHAHTSPLPFAPELCVEVVSPSNSRVEMAEKIEAYLQAGAQEVWIVSEARGVEFHDAAGPLDDSRIAPGFSL